VTHEQAITAAVRIGCESVFQIAAQLGIETRRVTTVVCWMTRTGALYRTPTYGGPGEPVWRYRLPDAPDVLAERRARVERMREWAPSALEEMRRAS
jgi:hypothetical protein